MKILTHGNKQPGRLNKSVSQLLTTRAVVVLLLCLAASLLLVTAVQASGAWVFSTQLLGNPDFEAGNLSSWGGSGTGIVAAENCCGQHDTPYWGYTRPDVDRWNAYIQPNGQETFLYQYKWVAANVRYRLSSWFFTNGMTGNLKRWSPGANTRYNCASTTSTSFVPVSCEFTPGISEYSAVQLIGNAAPNLWTVSDDWALTPIVTVPRLANQLKWTNRPVRYYVDWYVTRTDMAAASWNSSTGLSLLTRTSDINQAKIRFDVRDFGNTTWWAQTIIPNPLPPEPNRIITIQVNKYHLQPWSSYIFGYESRQGVIAHEFGHALGLYHVFGYCQLLNDSGYAMWYCGVYTPTSGDRNGMLAIYP